MPVNLLNAVAIGFYLLTSAACCSAAVLAWLRRRLRSESVWWTLVATIFGLLAIVRATGFEETVRSGLRASISEAGFYGERVGLQVIVILLVLGMAAGAAYAIWRSWIGRRRTPSERLTFFAIMAACSFLPLYAVRIASLHLTDAILYSGPLRLNWILDAGFTLTALVCASLYAARRLGMR